MLHKSEPAAVHYSALLHCSESQSHTRLFRRHFHSDEPPLKTNKSNRWPIAAQRDTGPVTAGQRLRNSVLMTYGSASHPVLNGALLSEHFLTPGL